MKNGIKTSSNVSDMHADTAHGSAPQRNVTWIELYQEVYTNKWQKNKTQTMAKIAHHLIKKHLGFNNSILISPPYIQELQKEFESKGYSKSTLYSKFCALRTMLHYAEKHMQFDFSQVIKSLPKYNKVHKKDHYLNQQEIQKALSYFKNNKTTSSFYVLAMLYFETGLKTKKAHILRYADIYHNRIVVPGDDCQTNREIFISDQLIRAIFDHKESQGKESTDYIFQDITPYAFRKEWSAMVKTSGIKKCTQSITRSTAATNLAAANVSVFEIQKQLAHKNLNTTLNAIYL